MASAWGIFGAAKMNGLDDRGERYQVWYATVELLPGEQLMAGWHVIHSPRSWLKPLAGNLLLSDLRLMFEPYSAKRAVHAPHGMKHVINNLAKLAERNAPPIPYAIPLAELASIERSGTDRMATLTVRDRWGNAAEFLPSQSRPPVGPGHRARRDDAVRLIGEAVKP